MGEPRELVLLVAADHAQAKLHLRRFVFVASFETLRIICVCVVVSHHFTSEIGRYEIVSSACRMIWDRARAIAVAVAEPVAVAVAVAGP